jgi:rhodanese-related sulfurtransferase
MKIGYQQLLLEAEQDIETLQADDVHLLLGSDEVAIIDIRDVRELEREGKIPQAYHAPRGMLEFWIDPASPYHREIFSSGKKFIFYCQSGWRSALATQQVQHMGLEPVAHLAGGFRNWAASALPIEPLSSE